jgi:hypothetical protein
MQKNSQFKSISTISETTIQSIQSNSPIEGKN